jgi:predicted GIY-YIG superfamily endonuclease
MVGSTKFYAPLNLVYYEAYLDKRDALNREKALKHHGSIIGLLKKRLVTTLCKKGIRGVAQPFVSKGWT